MSASLSSDTLFPFVTTKPPALDLDFIPPLDARYGYDHELPFCSSAADAPSMWQQPPSSAADPRGQRQAHHHTPHHEPGVGAETTGPIAEHPAVPSSNRVVGRRLSAPTSTFDLSLDLDSVGHSDLLAGLRAGVGIVVDDDARSIEADAGHHAAHDTPSDTSSFLASASDTSSFLPSASDTSSFMASPIEGTSASMPFAIPAALAVRPQTATLPTLSAPFGMTPLAAHMGPATAPVSGAPPPAPYGFAQGAQVIYDYGHGQLSSRIAAMNPGPTLGSPPSARRRSSSRTASPAGAAGGDGDDDSGAGPGVGSSGGSGKGKATVTGSGSLAGPSSSSSQPQDVNAPPVKRKRNKTTTEQLAALEAFFARNRNPTAKLREELSITLDMPERSVQVWFQNRRAKVKANEKKAAAAGPTSTSTPPTGSGLPGKPLAATRTMRSGSGSLSLNLNPALMNFPPNMPVTAMGSAAAAGGMFSRFGTRAGLAGRPRTMTEGGGGVLGGLERESVTPFPVTQLTIGTWRRVSPLVCFFSRRLQTLTWYLSSDSVGFKLETSFSAVRSVTFELCGPGQSSGGWYLGPEGSATSSEGQEEGMLIVDLERPPTFFMQVVREGHATTTITNTPPPAAAATEGDGRAFWRQCADFTENRQATQVLRHVLTGPAVRLRDALLKLAETEGPLRDLIHFGSSTVVLPLPMEPSMYFSVPPTSAPAMATEHSTLAYPTRSASLSGLASASLADFPPSSYHFSNVPRSRTSAGSIGGDSVASSHSFYGSLSSAASTSSLSSLHSSFAGQQTVPYTSMNPEVAGLAESSMAGLRLESPVIGTSASESLAGTTNSASLPTFGGGGGGSSSGHSLSSGHSFGEHIQQGGHVLPPALNLHGETQEMHFDQMIDSFSPLTPTSAVPRPGFGSSPAALQSLADAQPWPSSYEHQPDASSYPSAAPPLGAGHRIGIAGSDDSTHMQFDATSTQPHVSRLDMLAGPPPYAAAGAVVVKTPSPGAGSPMLAKASSASLADTAPLGAEGGQSGPELSETDGRTSVGSSFSTSTSPQTTTTRDGGSVHLVSPKLPGSY